MSYAAAAAKGPKQTAEEKRAPAPPEVIHSSDASTSSLIDVDTESVHLVPSDFKSQSVTTDTQEARIEREAEQIEAKAKEEFEHIQKEFAKKEKEAKAKAKKIGGQIERNSDNPVFIANAAAVTVIGAGLGFGAYRKYAAGELTWKLAAAWAGVVGLFVAGDYYASAYYLKKYPAKK